VFLMVCRENFKKLGEKTELDLKKKTNADFY
jgi:hypothetical protein